MDNMELSAEAMAALRGILLKEIGKEGVKKLGEEGINDLGVRLLHLTAIWLRVREAQVKEKRRSSNV